MNHSEYLRRKLESLPRVYGRTQLKDESMRTMVMRFSATQYDAHRTPNTIAPETCCGTPKLFQKEGDGQQQEWSHERKIANGARCVCSTWKAGAIEQGCCIQESTPELPRDENGAIVSSEKRAAYKGKETCCPYLSTREVEPAPLCCVGTGRIRTMKANDMPSVSIPIPPAEKACCSSIIETNSTYYDTC